MIDAAMTEQEWEALFGNFDTATFFTNDAEGTPEERLSRFTDREYDQEALYVTLNYLGLFFEPIDRASYYTALQMTLKLDGTMALNDHELALLAWAPNDNQASEAVEAVRDGTLDAELYGGNPLYYLENVSHNGSVTAAQNKILDEDGWQQPGGITGLKDQARDYGRLALSVVNTPGAMMSPALMPFAMGNPNQRGKSFDGDSRLWPIIESTYEVRRSNIESLRAPWEDWRPRIETGFEAASGLAAIFAGAGSAWKLGKFVIPKMKPAITVAAPWIATQLNKMPGVNTQEAIKKASRFGTTANNVLGWKTTPQTQTMSFVLNRTGMRTADVLQRMSWESGANLSSRNLGAMTIIGGLTIGAVSTSTIYGNLNADKIDATRIKRLEEQRRRQGLEPEEAVELETLNQRRAERDSITKQGATVAGLVAQQRDLPFADAGVGPAAALAATVKPLLSEAVAQPVDQQNEALRFDSLDPGEGVGVSMSPTSPLAALIVTFVDLMDNAMIETNRRVTEMNALELAVQGSVPPTSSFTDSDTGENVSTPPTSTVSEAELNAAVDEISETGNLLNPEIWSTYTTALEQKVQSIMGEFGLTFYDAETMPPLKEINDSEGYVGENDGWTLYEDISAPKGLERKILLPPEMKAAQFDQYMKEWVDPDDLENLDPLIRVPEDYSARMFDRELKTPGGGQVAGTNSRYGGLDVFEARFIEKAQGFGGVDVEGQGVPAEYRQSDILDMINGMSFTKVMEFQDLAAKAGFYGENRRPFTSGYMTTGDQDIVVEVLGQANVDGESFWQMLNNMASNPSRYQVQGKDQPTSTPSTPYSVPLSLRSIPGPKSIAEQAKQQFERQLGRQARPDELASIAQEMTGTYTAQNQELIALDMARYEGSNAGLITGAQFKAIEDPQSAASYDIANKWKDEINLNDRREANSDSFNRIVNATMGNRVSTGSLTPGGVQQIERE